MSFKIGDHQKDSEKVLWSYQKTTKIHQAWQSCQITHPIWLDTYWIHQSKPSTQITHCQSWTTWTHKYIDTYDDDFYENPPTESCPQLAEPAQLTEPHETPGQPTEPAQMPEPHQTHWTPPAAESCTCSGCTVKKQDRLIQTMWLACANSCLWLRFTSPKMHYSIMLASLKLRDSIIFALLKLHDTMCTFSDIPSIFCFRTGIDFQGGRMFRALWFDWTLWFYPLTQKHLVGWYFLLYNYWPIRDEYTSLPVSVSLSSLYNW